MRIAVSGGRNYADAHSVKFALTAAVKAMRAKIGNNEAITLIHGGATGADALAHKWAEWWCQKYNEEVDIVICEANWQAYGKAAGPARNSTMAEGIPGIGKPDLWVFFPGGRGTADAYRKAIAAGIPTMCINITDLGSPYIPPPGEIIKP